MLWKQAYSTCRKCVRLSASLTESKRLHCNWCTGYTTLIIPTWTPSQKFPAPPLNRATHAYCTQRRYMLWPLFSQAVVVLVSVADLASPAGFWAHYSIVILTCLYLSIYLSLSDTLMHCVKTANHIINLFHLPWQNHSNVLTHKISRQNFDAM